MDPVPDPVDPDPEAWRVPAIDRRRGDLGSENQWGDSFIRVPYMYIHINIYNIHMYIHVYTYPWKCQIKP